ncbi:MAG: TetR/AcrR family transcriptional regulator [Gemmatimonadales bacterium]
MSPRPYRMDRRRESTDETRLRIINAAREILSSPKGSARFSVDAVGRQAGVARMTVYYQFGSKRGLVEGICDSLAIAGGMDRMAAAFSRTDPLQALDEFIVVLMHFWESDRPVRRGLGALTVLDPETAAVLEARSGRRRQGLRVLLGRLAKETGHPRPRELEDAVDLLYMLTSFHTYDSLAGPKRNVDRVTTMIQELARRVLA